jgi:O-antigen/teichoic acid export membrane protein
MTPSASSVHSPASDRAQLQKFARRGTASVAGAGFSAVFGVLLVVIVTNGFSPTVAGTLFSATSVFLILESIALLGTDTGLVKWLPTQLASGRAGDLTRTLVVAVVPVLALSVATAAALYLSAPYLAPDLVGPAAAPTMELMLRVLALVLPVAALNDLVMAATRGTGSMRPTVVFDNIGRLGLQSMGVLVAYLAGGGPVALAAAWSVPYALSLLAAGSWLRSTLGSTTSAGSPTPWPRIAREFWVYTVPRAIARVTQTALKRSDIILVAALASPAHAALYTAATRFIVVGQLFVQSVQQALSPQLSAMFARGETRAADSVFKAATLWSVIASWPFYLVLAGFAPDLMSIFGSGYGAASDVVVILSLTMLLATACGPVDSVLLMAGHSWLSLRNGVIALTVNVGLNLLLIPLYGIRGAAIAWSISIVVRNLQPLVQVRRFLGLWPITRATVRVSGLGLGCFGIVTAGVLALHLPLAVDVAMVGIGTVAYLYVIWAWRETLGLEAFGAALRRRTPGGTHRVAAEV